MDLEQVGSGDGTVVKHLKVELVDLVELIEEAVDHLQHEHSV